MVSNIILMELKVSLDGQPPLSICFKQANKRDFCLKEIT